MGAILSSGIRSDINGIFDDVIAIMKPLPSTTTAASLKYLSRKDVRAQAQHLMSPYLPGNVQMKVANILGIAYLELYITPDADRTKTYFWPCSDCACIALREQSMDPC